MGDTTRCEKCIHNKICVQQVNIQTDTYAYMNVKYDTEKCRYYIAADMVPSEEVAEIFEEIDKLVWRYWNDNDYTMVDIERVLYGLKKKYIGEQK